MILFLSCSSSTLDTSTNTTSYFSVEAQISAAIPTVVTLHVESEVEGTIIASTIVQDTVLETKPVFIPHICLYNPYMSL